MSTIQEIINTHTSEMVVRTELEMNRHLLEIKEKLIRDLAEKYEFDVEEALEHFAEQEVGHLVHEDKPVTKTKTKTKKAKKVKDPNEPKRPTTAYFYFMKEKRAEVSEEAKTYAAEHESLASDAAKAYEEIADDASEEELADALLHQNNTKLEFDQAAQMTKTTEITKKLGAMWQLIKNGPDAKPYDDMNSADKIRYESEKLLYSSPSSPTSD
jgi:hypothetical protein